MDGGSRPDEPFPIAAIDVHRIDRRFLYLVMPGAQALRYGVGVGRQGFGWSGHPVGSKVVVLAHG